MSEPSTSQLKAKEKAEPIEGGAHPASDAESGSDGEGSPDENDLAHAASSSSAATPSTAGKKKKKKRSKVAKALSALRPGASKDAISDDVVKIVLDKVRAEGGEAAAAADPEMVRQALEQMKLRELLEGKAGIGGKNKKDTGGHKVCGLEFGLVWMPRPTRIYVTVLVDATCSTAG